MNIVIFSHPTFMSSQSMPRFARLLVDGMQQRGHQVEVWSPAPKFWHWTSQPFARKWLGYVDQYVLFPAQVRRRLVQMPADTLFVFADNALGPWVSLVTYRPHVVHCHDFLAQQSALGQIPENPTGWTGQQYQAYIRRGYRQARNFISVSQKTRYDLHEMLTTPPALSEVVYNGMNGTFVPGDIAQARAELSIETGLSLSDGYLLHVGGNQWYKNRPGVILLYDAWRERTAPVQKPLPLLLIGEAPNAALLAQYEASPYRDAIHFVSKLSDTLVKRAYQGGTLLLFPSLNEGFGWPIAEAMASGCLVLTTDAAPMSEVAGEAGFSVPRMPHDEAARQHWARQGADTIERSLHLSDSEREAAVKAGITTSKRFQQTVFFDQMEAIYQQILQPAIAGSVGSRPSAVVTKAEAS